MLEPTNPIQSSTKLEFAQEIFDFTNQYIIFGSTNKVSLQSQKQLEEKVTAYIESGIVPDNLSEEELKYLKSYIALYYSKKDLQPIHQALEWIATSGQIIKIPKFQVHASFAYFAAMLLIARHAARYGIGQCTAYVGLVICYLLDHPDIADTIEIINIANKHTFILINHDNPQLHSSLNSISNFGQAQIVDAYFNQSCELNLLLDKNNVLSHYYHKYYPDFYSSKILTSNAFAVSKLSDLIADESIRGYIQDIKAEFTGEVREKNLCKIESTYKRFYDAYQKSINEKVITKNRDSNFNINFISMTSHHYCLLKKIKPICNRYPRNFMAFLSLIEQKQYNKALRSICNYNEKALSDVAYQLIEILLHYTDKLPIDITEQAGDKNWSALHYAANNANQRVYELLIAKGAKDNVIDNRGLTPADYAKQLNNESKKFKP